jgi:hypothetical protein
MTALSISRSHCGTCAARATPASIDSDCSAMVPPNVRRTTPQRRRSPRTSRSPSVRALRN